VVLINSLPLVFFFEFYDSCNLLHVDCSNCYQSACQKC